jgi:hypothetical protein
MIYEQYLPTNITTNTTTTVKTGSGLLHAVVINTKGATSNIAKIYDGSASGTLLATIDTTGGAATLWYDVQFSQSLTVVTSAGTCADLTICYR